MEFISYYKHRWLWIHKLLFHRLLRKNSPYNKFGSKHYCFMLFIHVSQAFDNIWHNMYKIYKIKNLLPADVHHIFRSYRESYFTTSNFNLFSWKKNSTSFPQRSILEDCISCSLYICQRVHWLTPQLSGMSLHK